MRTMLFETYRLRLSIDAMVLASKIPRLFMCLSTWTGTANDREGDQEDDGVLYNNSTEREAQIRHMYKPCRRDDAQLIFRSSTSNSRVEFGGMTGGKPRAP